MQDKFEMSIIDELTFFMGKQVKQLDSGFLSTKSTIWEIVETIQNGDMLSCNNPHEFIS